MSHARSEEEVSEYSFDRDGLRVYTEMFTRRLDRHSKVSGTSDPNPNSTGGGVTYTCELPEDVSERLVGDILSGLQGIADRTVGGQALARLHDVVGRLGYGWSERDETRDVLHTTTLPADSPVLRVAQAAYPLVYSAAIARNALGPSQQPRHNTPAGKHHLVDRQLDAAAQTAVADPAVFGEGIDARVLVQQLTNDIGLDIGPVV